MEEDMPDLFDNPIGLDGFDFVEFAAPDPKVLVAVFESLGFGAVAHHRSKAVTLYRQGGINLVVNQEPASPAQHFAAEHGPSACALGFRVRDAGKAYARLLAQGAEPVEGTMGPMELKLPAIRGIGGAPIYLIDRYDEGSSIFDIDFRFIEGVERRPSGCGLMEIDHLTHNLYQGRMSHWAEFYQRLFNFKEIRFFDIKGEYTGLRSRAMSAPDGRIRIPLNEEASEGRGQIEEFLLDHNGEGIQHIAFSTPDIYATVDALRARGVPFMTTPPERYYEMLETRLPGHGEPVAEMKARGILIDGSTEEGDPRILLQIFTQTLLGPVFFEIIQRKRDEGFGEGNFQALFESIERDQIARGVISVDA
jgi:4-hydroxyphenylpyruvate dioxygenase